jgi:hypothetical protein
MITGIFTIIGVLVGFYLAKFEQVNTKVAETIQTLKEKTKKDYGEPFVVDKDESVLEAEEIAKEERKEERIDVKSFTKENGGNTEAVG